nr:CDP-diacylglycerol--serine O-phosphatidyltransferase 1-like isoform X1 [Ipomoea batatas]
METVALLGGRRRWLAIGRLSGKIRDDASPIYGSILHPDLGVGPLLKLNYYFLQNFLKDPYGADCRIYVYLKIPRTGQANTWSVFTPAHWDKDEWHPLLVLWRFLQVLSLCVCVYLTHSSSSILLFGFLSKNPFDNILDYVMVADCNTNHPGVQFLTYKTEKPVKKGGNILLAFPLPSASLNF